MKLAAVGSNCIDFYNNIDGGKAYPGGGPVNMAVRKQKFISTKKHMKKC